MDTSTYLIGLVVFEQDLYPSLMAFLHFGSYGPLNPLKVFIFMLFHSALPGAHLYLLVLKRVK